MKKLLTMSLTSFLLLTGISGTTYAKSTSTLADETGIDKKAVLQDKKHQQTALPVNDEVVTKPSKTLNTFNYVIPSSEYIPNYYNKPMKFKQFDMNTGLDGYFYDYGQATKISGYDASNYLSKLVTNNKLTLNQDSKHEGVLIRNIEPLYDAYRQGSGVVIGKHTIATSQHVVDKMESKTAYDVANPKNIKIDIGRSGNAIKKTITAKDVVSLKYGEVALIHTNEDLSQYTNVQKLASENTIRQMKYRMPISMNHYSNMSMDNYATDKMRNDYFPFKPYTSNGYFLMKGHNIHPVMYFKSYANVGGSGSAIKNQNNQVIGLFYGSASDEVGAKDNMKVGFMFINNLRKELKANTY